MNCTELYRRLDEQLDGALNASDAAACAVHLKACAACAGEASRRTALRAALRDMPVAAPHPGFIDGALARAVSSPPPSRREARQRFSLRHLIGRREAWLGAALGGALAAGLAVLFLAPMEVARTPVDVVALAVNETREVGVLIDSDTPLEGATIRIIVTGGVSLEGYDEGSEIAWQTDLDRGANLLSLPVVARVPGVGRIVAIVEHTGKTKRVAVELKVS